MGLVRLLGHPRISFRFGTIFVTTFLNPAQQFTISQSMCDLICGCPIGNHISEEKDFP